MHKRLFNEAIIDLNIRPVGPILIKAGEGDADPAKPDMNFVCTKRDGRETVYLPGSSLKGVLRAHCERLARTVDSEQRQKRHGKPLACDPLDEGDNPRKEPNQFSCCRYFERKDVKEELKNLEEKMPGSATAETHRRSCFLCQLFGNTSMASHFRISDAYPIGEYRTEERNGVAIDRVFGSVAVGPFNYETVTSGTFKTTLHVKNFTLAHLGLLSLALRDLVAGRVRIGFGKSRGLGVVTASVTMLTLGYPPCELREGQLHLLGGQRLGEAGQIIGVGEFVKNDGYGYPSPDSVPMPDGYGYTTNEWGRVEIHAPALGDAVAWEPLGRACVPMWRKVVENGR